ncbi:MAG: hypothetical protein HQ567_18435 [Candidatus Nealsonbacteria bacterium]|nr:hypothetical protein [Candidatus Nealsonbacteria bacterium]
MNAWNGWYHVNGHTYGTWLPGDPRGWREKGHKQHVAGDYKNPPPAGSGDPLLEYSRDALTQPPTHLDTAQREIVGRAIVERLVGLQYETIAFSLDEIHFHLLAKFSDGEVKTPVGLAKKHAYHELRDHGFERKLWGRRAHVVPIRDRQHQLNVFEYVVRHRENGAWVWTFREGVYWREEGGE